MTEPTRNDLIPAKTIASLLSHRRRVKRHAKAIRRHYKALSEICDTFLQDYSIQNFLHQHLLGGMKLRERVDGAFWKALVNSALLTNAMTARKRREFIQQLEGRESNGRPIPLDKRINIPIFKAAEIDKVAEQITQQYADTIEATILDVFKEFTNIRYHGHITGGHKHKVNNLKRIESKFIARGEIYWCGDRFEVREYNHCICFEDLLTAAYLCDIGVRPDYDKKFYALAQDGFHLSPGNIVTTPYFSIRCYKNGNHHVTWNPEKLVVLNMINKIGSGENPGIPGPHLKRYKREHFTS